MAHPYPDMLLLGEDTESPNDSLRDAIIDLNIRVSNLEKIQAIILEYLEKKEA